jgi:hypothetical protein
LRHNDANGDGDEINRSAVRAGAGWCGDVRGRL